MTSKSCQISLCDKKSHFKLNYPELACVRSLPWNLIKVIHQTNYKPRPILNEKVWFERNFYYTCFNHCRTRPQGAQGAFDPLGF